MPLLFTLYKILGTQLAVCIPGHEIDASKCFFSRCEIPQIAFLYVSCILEARRNIFTFRSAHIWKTFDLHIVCKATIIKRIKTKFLTRTLVKITIFQTTSLQLTTQNKLRSNSPDRKFLLPFKEWKIDDGFSPRITISCADDYPIEIVSLQADSSLPLI